MRLGVLSDTHDQIAVTQAAVRLLRAEGAEALIHCGDITGPDIVFACAVLPCYFVFGNHDADNVRLLESAASQSGAVCLGWGGEVTLAGKRVAVTHGHLHIDVRPLLASRPDYLLTGHSHIAADWREGPTRRINPGPLFRSDDLTVALLDLATDDLAFLRVIV
jgi:putative phosphoesterase